MIAVSIIERRTPNADGHGKKSLFHVAVFLPPSDDVALAEAHFRTFVGENLAHLLDRALAGHDDDTLSVGLGGAATAMNREVVGTNSPADLRSASIAWRKREGYGPNDEAISKLATYGQGDEEYVTVAVRGALLRIIRQGAAKAHLRLHRIVPLAYAWAEIVAKDVHVLLDTTALADEILTVRIFTPPTATEGELRDDDDLLDSLETNISIVERRRHFGSALLEAVHVIGNGKLRFTEVLGLPIVPTRTDIPAKYHPYLGLFALADYTVGITPNKDFISFNFAKQASKVGVWVGELIASTSALATGVIALVFVLVVAADGVSYIYENRALQAAMDRANELQRAEAALTPDTKRVAVEVGELVTIINSKTVNGKLARNLSRTFNELDPSIGLQTFAVSVPNDALPTYNITGDTKKTSDIDSFYRRINAATDLSITTEAPGISAFTLGVSGTGNNAAGNSTSAMSMPPKGGPTP
jgi:hypothetical protein